MSNKFYIADLHLGHKNILNFKREDGTPLRPFTSLAEMHGLLIENWNSVVQPQDTVYVLGDVALDKKSLYPLLAMRGRKILIKGNHDTEKLKTYQNYFADVRSCDLKKPIIATHIPIHPSSVTAFGTNVHGHLHNRSLNDPRYFCVSVERINYTPIEYDDLLSRITKQQTGF